MFSAFLLKYYRSTTPVLPQYCPHMQDQTVFYLHLFKVGHKSPPEWSWEVGKEFGLVVVSLELQGESCWRGGGVWWQTADPLAVKPLKAQHKAAGTGAPFSPQFVFFAQSWINVTYVFSGSWSSVNRLWSMSAPVFIPLDCTVFQL